MDNPSSPNPQVIRVGGTITYTLTVTVDGQTFTDEVTINATPPTGGVCPCDHAYEHNGSYQAPTGSADYELGTPGQLTIIDAQNYPTGEVTFNGTYHVMGPVLFEELTVRLEPGTTFYVDPDASYLVSPSCYPSLGLDEFAARIYVGKSGVLELHNATIASTCDKLWGGITLRENGQLLMDDNSVVRDAQVGVMAGEYCEDVQTHYSILNSEFNNCRFGLVDLQKQAVAAGDGVTGTLFTSDPTTMLAPYQGKYGDTGLIIDGPNVGGLLLQYNSFDNLVTGAVVSGYNTFFDQNTFTRCYSRSISVGSFVNGMTHARQLILSDNDITVPNDYLSAPGQFSAADLVAGIVLNEPSSTIISVTGNTITGAGSTPVTTPDKPQAGIISYSFNNLSIRGGNVIGNLDYGIRLQNVGADFCTVCPPGPVIGTVVADNTLNNNTQNIHLQGNAQYAYAIPQIECNTLNNTGLTGLNYGIYIASQTWLPDLGTSSRPNANRFINTTGTRSVWNDGGNFLPAHPPYSTTYWGYNTENISNAGAGFGSLLSVDQTATQPDNVCSNREYSNAGLNRGVAVTAQQVSDWQQQLYQKRGAARERWYLEQDVLRYYHEQGQQATLEGFVRTLPLVNDSAFYRLSFYLLAHYQRSGQLAARQSLRTYLLMYGNGEANVVNTLAYTEVMQRLAQTRRGLSSADSLQLAQVAHSGTSMAEAACMTLRTFHPGSSCASAAPTPAPAPRTSSAVELTRPRISGLYPNPAIDQVRVRYAGPTGHY